MYFYQWHKLSVKYCKDVPKSLVFVYIDEAMASMPTSDEHPASASAKIMYTYTDEAPMLATHAFFPIIKAF